MSNKLKEEIKEQKDCILFSGQGSQYSGMAKELVGIFPDAAKVFECAGDILGIDLRAICFFGTAEELAKTKVAQPAIMATSLAAYEAVKSIGIVPSCVAGHSLGEYAAMVASGVLSMEDGFRVIKERANAMDECTKGQDGMMCAVIGIDAKDVFEVCNTVDGYVVPVNFNSLSQTVIAGESEAVMLAMDIFADMGVRTAKLAVSAAFHSKFMQGAADMFYDSIKDINFKAAEIDFYSNLTGEKMADFSDMPTYLKTHLVSPVQFVSELNAISQTEVTRFIECGPNKVLSGLVRKTLKGVAVANVEDEKSFSKLLGE